MSSHMGKKDRQIRSIKTTFRKTVAKAGLEDDVTPYTIRHTMATELRKRGVPPWEVSGLLGHKSAGYATTEIYAKFDPDYLGKAVAAIDAYFGDLQKHVGRHIVRPLRASCVPVADQVVTQVPDLLVGASGFEPPTPTMSR